MAEKGDSQQRTPDHKEDETPPTNSDHSAACDEHKPTDGSDVSDSSSSSLISSGENVKQAVQNGDPAGKQTAPPTGKSSLEDDSKENSNPHGSDGESPGDSNRNEQQQSEGTPGEEHNISGDRRDGQGDGAITKTDEKASDTNDTNTDAGEGGDSEKVTAPPTGKSSPEDGSKENSSPHGSDGESHGDSKKNEQQPSEGNSGEEHNISGDRRDDQDDGRITKTDETDGESPEDSKKNEQQPSEGTPGTRRYLAAVCLVVFVAVVVQHLLQPESPPQKNDVRQIDVFLKQMEKVQTVFPNQRSELWNRARIHLKRHLLTAQPTEPVSLILTAGLRAERTLLCLAQGLASAFSSALNASVLHIDGAGQASEDSDQVKLDIDSKLQGAFEGDKPVAVIHRFEELPPGSTLIFYRYCDHENAAYKKTFLIFTVLLGEEQIPAKIRLSAVEEMVDDHLQKKFLTHGHPVSFDRMDLDKYGGLWSRISHLILPVAAEDRIEHEGC